MNRLVVRNSLVAALATFSGGLSLAQTPAPLPAMTTIQMPVAPAPVAVSLKAAGTALVVSDMIDPICKSQPKCTSVMVPAVAGLIARARKAGIPVVYTTQAANASKWLPEVAPAAGEAFVASRGQDRFFETDLDKVLKEKGVTTIVLTGWKISGSVLYTSVGATLRGYTVVVPADASLATTDYDIAIGIYQMLTQNAANAANEPLKPRTSTLSRSDLITFQ